MEILQNILVTDLIVGLVLYLLLRIPDKEDDRVREPSTFDLWLTALLVLDVVVTVVVALILVWL